MTNMPVCQGYGLTLLLLSFPRAPTLCIETQLTPNAKPQLSLRRLHSFKIPNFKIISSPDAFSRRVGGTLVDNGAY